MTFLASLMRIEPVRACVLTLRYFYFARLLRRMRVFRDPSDSVSANTVKYHLTNMFEKLGVSNRIELARFAVQHRLDPNHYTA